MLPAGPPNKGCVYGLVKSGLDAHTLGISHLAQLLEECGMSVCIAASRVCQAASRHGDPRNFEIFKQWILSNRIRRLGFSDRLDPDQAFESFERLVRRLDGDPVLSAGRQGQIEAIYFAGLPEACRLVERTFGRRFPTFQGDETPVETLRKVGVPETRIPRSIREQSVYDELRLDFGRRLLEDGLPASVRPHPRPDYAAFGTESDHLIGRLDAARRRGTLPLFRAHVGPYLKDRAKALALFSDWLKKLSDDGFLDIVSVGSSQLSQSMFGRDWEGLPNGGGVPFNSEFELRAIREDAAPMLVRAYSGTDRVADVARALEENLNMAWHALSLWWFNRIDGRGPLSVGESLGQHVETLRYIASRGKPFEPNVPHHFAFRGSDDIASVVSACLAARLAKRLGIRFLVLQNMLNTPKSTLGVRDLAKARALLGLVRQLEDGNFRVIYQPRAGLDYFSPDLEKAKVQLAAVSALMDDVEPDREDSPPIVHVVSYSEARFLATPDVINDSIRITRSALAHYPAFREKNSVSDIILGRSLREATEELLEDARLMVADMERTVPDVYTPGGLLEVFRRGYFPLPYLWEGREEFPRAVDWETKIVDGGIAVIDGRGRKMPMSQRLVRIRDWQDRSSEE